MLRQKTFESFSKEKLIKDMNEGFRKHRIVKFVVIINGPKLSVLIRMVALPMVELRLRKV